MNQPKEQDSDADTPSNIFCTRFSVHFQEFQEENAILYVFLQVPLEKNNKGRRYDDNMQPTQQQQTRITRKTTKVTSLCLSFHFHPFTFKVNVDVVDESCPAASFLGSGV